MSLFRKLVGVFQAAGLSIRKRLLGGLPPVYVEEVFSTYLYTGNGNATSRTIQNEIDLSTKGGMVWIKSRTGAVDHDVTDTARGARKPLFPNRNYAQDNNVDYAVNSFLTNGFTLASTDSLVNQNSQNYVSWTFREQPKFFDVLTYTGNGTAGTAISHSLGSTPGFILVKRTDTGGSTGQNWVVWHRSAGGTGYFNSTNALDSSFPNSIFWGNGSSYVAPTSTTFTVTDSQNVNASGGSYVAYLFAHNAGGFGLTETDNVISCGSYVGNGSATGPEIDLGYEPQWLLIKRTVDDGYDWFMWDTMRGLTSTGTGNKELYANLAQAEQAATGMGINSRGFQPLRGDAGGYNANGKTYIYIAIRRGPMKVPTVGTSVFSPAIWTGNDTARTITSNIVTDFAFIRGQNTGGTGSAVADRMRGANNILQFESTGSAFTDTGTINGFDLNTGIKIGGHSSVNWNTYNFVAECFKRAPGFFDIVCYTGNGSTPGGFSHNLGVTPEMVIVKSRSSGSENWRTWVINYSFSQALSVNSTAASTSGSFGGAGLIPADSATFYVSPSSTPNNMNESGTTYVAYLFATCPGVSKVGTYTGTGTTLQIDCGFTGGARFVMIKRKDSTGDWYFWDTTRGIIAGNDPYLFLNSNANEVTSTDYIDPYSPGFELSSSAPAALNASGGTFIFLAIA